MRNSLSFNGKFSPPKAGIGVFLIAMIAMIYFQVLYAAATPEIPDQTVVTAVCASPESTVPTLVTVSNEANILVRKECATIMVKKEAGKHANMMEALTPPLIDAQAAQTTGMFQMTAVQDQKKVAQTSQIPEVQVKRMINPTTTVIANDNLLQKDISSQSSAATAKSSQIQVTSPMQVTITESPHANYTDLASNTADKIAGRQFATVVLA